ncbi:MAG TPA: DUF2024 family protein [Flavitalea sp.]|nr:DUF2024 family protein [Flavitalea sp.]
MQVAVWDTYVTRRNGTIMHFDIIVPSEINNTGVIYGYGKEYLATKGEGAQDLHSEACRFCHVESVRPQWESAIRQKGYFIYEMENCE